MSLNMDSHGESNFSVCVYAVRENTCVFPDVKYDFGQFLGLFLSSCNVPINNGTERNEQKLNFK